MSFKNLPWEKIYGLLDFLGLWFDALFNEKMFIAIFDPCLFAENIVYLYKNSLDYKIDLNFFFRCRNLDFNKNILEKINTYIDSKALLSDEGVFGLDIHMALITFKVVIAHNINELTPKIQSFSESNNNPLILDNTKRALDPQFSIDELQPKLKKRNTSFPPE